VTEPDRRAAEPIDGWREGRSSACHASLKAPMEAAVTEDHPAAARAGEASASVHASEAPSSVHAAEAAAAVHAAEASTSVERHHWRNKAKRRAQGDRGQANEQFALHGSYPPTGRNGARGRSDRRQRSGQKTHVISND
jgi:hypothetical protein